MRPAGGPTSWRGLRPLALLRPSALVALCVCGCNDLELRLRIISPENQQGLAATVSVDLFEPPVGEPFTCDDLAFSSVAPIKQDVSRLRSLTLTDDGDPIGPIDRLSTTLTVAHATSPERVTLASGCATVEPFDSDVDVDLALEPAVTLSLTSPTASAVPGKTLELRVTARDADGNPVPNVALRWIAVGARAEMTRGAADTDVTGTARVAVAPPELTGPVTTQVRGRWAVNNPALIPGFVKPVGGPTTTAKEGIALAHATGRFGDHSTWAIAVVVDVHGQPFLRYCSGSTPLTCPSQPIPLSGSGPIVRVTSDDEDRLLLATDDTVYVYRGPTPEDGQAHGGGVPARFLPAGTCPGAPRALLIFDDGRRELYNAHGQLLSDAPLPTIEGEPLLSGCVTTDASDTRRAYLTRTEQAYNLYLVAPNGDAITSAPWFGLPLPIAFGPLFNGQQSMLGVKTRVDDFLVTQGTVLLEQRKVVTKDYVPVPSLPLALNAGDFDGDGLLDTVTLIADSTASPSTPTALWTVLGAQAGAPSTTAQGPNNTSPGSNVAGRLPLRYSHECPVGLLVADLDGDGADEVIITGSMACTNGTPQPPAQISVVDMSPQS